MSQFLMGFRMCVRLVEQFTWARNPWLMFDGIVIYLSIMLEFALGERGEGFLIVLRLWRLVRIAHGVKTVGFTFRSCSVP